MLAQPADLFDESTWIAIFAFFFGAPLLGFIMGWVLSGNRYQKTRWKWVAGYYAIALALLALALSMARTTGQESALLFCSFYIVMLCGPILGLVLFALRPKGPCYPEGHCQSCGYNLTGNVSGRCSECGTDIDHQADQDELAPQRASARVPWLLGGLAIVSMILLSVGTRGSSSFLLGFWLLLLLILLPITIFVFLRSK